MIKLQTAKNNGNALIVTLLVISVLASIAFTTSRLAISELRQTSQLEDSEMAYQSAEAGIESGLLLFRYNQNSEMPLVNMTSENNAYFGYNLSDGIVMGENEKKDPLKQYYQLRIWHKNNSTVEEIKSQACRQKDLDDGKCVSVDNKYFNSDYVNGIDEQGIISGMVVPALSQDNFVEYDFSGLNNTSDIYINWRFAHDAIAPETDKLKLQYIPKDSDGANIISDSSGGKYAYGYENSQNSSNINLNLPIKNILTTDGLKNVNKLRIKPTGEDILCYSISLNTSDVTQKADSRYSYIESIGYYGGSQRKLKIKIDRNTGSSLSPVDFLILQGE